MLNSLIDKNLLTKARKCLIQMHYEGGMGHIGGNLSSLDTMLLVFYEFKASEDEFILSKGCFLGALHISLWS